MPFGEDGAEKRPMPIQSSRDLFGYEAVEERPTVAAFGSGHGIHRGTLYFEKRGFSEWKAIGSRHAAELSGLSSVAVVLRPDPEGQS